MLLDVNRKSIYWLILVRLFGQVQLEMLLFDKFGWEVQYVLGSVAVQSENLVLFNFDGKIQLVWIIIGVPSFCEFRSENPVCPHSAFLSEKPPLVNFDTNLVNK